MFRCSCRRYSRKNFRSINNSSIRIDRYTRSSKKHLDEAETIVIATDSDREGEAIARLIINLSGNSRKTIKRLWINSLETSEIKKRISKSEGRTGVLFHLQRSRNPTNR
ncbi:toprim domain-containing protein [Enterococcus faecium]|nr:toprim domain-containing protein [Enterococcus faecium]